MPSTIIHNSKKYSLVEYENEKQLEDFAIINADYIFVLDKPLIEEDFFKEIEQINLPVVWIDHHTIE